MDSISIWHTIIVLFWIGVILLPGWRIARKAGFHGAWSLVLLVPLVNLVSLWVFAFVRWPSEKAKS